MEYTELQRANSLANCSGPYDFQERFFQEGEVYNTQIGRIEILSIQEGRISYFGRDGVIEDQTFEDIVKLHPRWIDPEKIKRRN